MVDPIKLEGHKTDAFILSLANGERSEALWTVPANTPAMKAGTILAADGTPATTADEAAAVLRHPTSLFTVDQNAAAICRDAEVHGERLAWPESTSDATKTAFAEALATKGIVVRWTDRPAGLENDASLPDDPPVDDGP